MSNKKTICKNCNGDKYTHITSVNEFDRLKTTGTKHCYKCNKCGQILWAFFYELNEENNLVKRKF